MVKDSCQQAFEQLLKTCAIKSGAKAEKGVKGFKKKRAMSGYNCFTKTLYAAEKERAKEEDRTPMSYSALLKMKTWSTLEAKQKVHWNGLADMGCPENA